MIKQIIGVLILLVISVYAARKAWLIWRSNERGVLPVVCVIGYTVVYLMAGRCAGGKVWEMISGL